MISLNSAISPLSQDNNLSFCTRFCLHWQKLEKLEMLENSYSLHSLFILNFELYSLRFVICGKFKSLFSRFPRRGTWKLWKHGILIHDKNNVYGNSGEKSSHEKISSNSRLYFRSCFLFQNKDDENMKTHRNLSRKILPSSCLHKWFDVKNRKLWCSFSITYLINKKREWERKKTLRAKGT